MIPQINTKAAYDLFHEGTLALAKAERQGICFDEKYATEEHAKLTKQIDKLERLVKKSQFYKEWQYASKSEVNINSDTQLADFLYNVKGHTPTSKTKTGKGATNEDALSGLKIKEVDLILKMRKLKKIRDTYLGSFMRENNNGVIHPYFNLNLVSTYRSSSANPNFQNIPKRDKKAMEITRRCLIPRPGHQLAELDFSQLEVMIAACYHLDPTMLKYLITGKDMHADIAKQVFFLGKFDKKNPAHSNLRKAAKNGFVFPQFYGDYFKPCAVNMGHKWGKLPMGIFKPKQGLEFDGNEHLSDHLMSNGINSMDDFISHIRKIEKHFWNKRFPVYRDWKEQQWDRYEKLGYLDSLTGFRYTNPSKSTGSTLGKNDAINYPVQGSAFHCLLWCFTRLSNLLEEGGFRSALVGQIHDAIVIDIHPEELEEVMGMARRVMTQELPNAFKWIIVPLRIEADLGPVDGSWATLKPYNFLLAS